MAIGYWGYPNGNIPTNAMTPIVSRGGTFYLKSDAAFWWGELAWEYFRVFGYWLDITDGYRSYAEQVYYWNAYRAGWGNVAAYPGTSNHGWGMAVDIYTPSFGGSAGTPRHNWLVNVGPRYGWTWWTGRASGESWHFEFTDTPTATPRPTTPAEPVYVPDEERPLYYRDTENNFVYALTDGSLRILGKAEGTSPTVGFAALAIEDKVANLTGDQTEKLIQWFGIEPVSQSFYDQIKTSPVPVKGLAVVTT